MDIGAELRAAREAKGLSIRTVAERTRVQPRMLAAIELNNVAAIPPRPFGRGFVRAFAKEVDLDPDRIVTSYFSQFPSTPIPNPPVPKRHIESADEITRPPSQWTGLITAAAILIAVVTTAVVVGRRNGPPSEVNAVGTTGAAPAAQTAAPATTRADVPAVPPEKPAVAPAAQSGAPLRLAFNVSRQCWVAASVDGTRVLYRIVEPGERQTLDAQREIAIRFGDAGAVAWTINGREGASLGASGAVRDLNITPQNHSEIR
jgi:cytoskeletal protein RodZ